MKYLCKIGIHNWQMQASFEIKNEKGRPYIIFERKCTRCGKRKATIYDMGR